MSDQARNTMPPLAEVSQYWEQLDDAILETIFPRLQSFGIGWGEPFCFRCGWLAPSKEAGNYPSSWKAARVLNLAWEAASGWLERAHLHDHTHGGDESPENLVPLCPICHEQQPSCRSRDEGIAFVNSEPPFALLMPTIQFWTDGHLRKAKLANAKSAHRRLLRAHAAAGLAYSKASDAARKAGS